MRVQDIRVNGGVASYVLANDEEKVYSDLDVIYYIDLSRDDAFRNVKDAVLRTLFESFPRQTVIEDVNWENLKVRRLLEEAYFHKVVDICNNNDRWNLLSFRNSKGGV